MCLSLFPFIIETIISKSLKKKEANNERNVQIKEQQVGIYSEHFKQIKNFKYLLILASGVLDFFKDFLYLISWII